MKHSVIRRIVLIALCSTLSLASALAQTMVKVHGTVVDNTGLPVVGASVLEQGTTNGVVTDLDGKYSIMAKEGSTLEFSFIGYTTVQISAKEGVMDVTLVEDMLFIEETVVVGYGVQKKSDLTGAISQVKSEDMANRTITSAAQALQGKTAGVQVYSGSAKPGASPSINIRGVSSNSSSSPLYVVDGRIASGIAGIDPNDIESMEILKDAASAAIYGVAAGNGVILVTTKKGKGDGTISYDYQYTSQSLGKVPQMMNSEQWISYYVDAGLLDMDKVNRLWDFKTNTDWTKVGFETSAMQRHNLSFSGGDERSSLFISASYLYNDGMVTGDSDIYSRLTGMINASRKIKPWLEIGTNNQIEYYKSRSVSEGSEYGSLLLSILQLDPLTPAYYTLDTMPAEYLQVLADHNKTDGNYKGELLGDGNGKYWAPSLFVTGENMHPFVMRDNSYNTSRGFNINGATYVNLTPIKGLVITSRLGYLLSSSESYGHSNDYWYSQQKQNDILSVSASTYANTYYQWENFVNYTRMFGKGHTLNLMAGTSYSQSRSFGVSGSIKGSGWNEDHTILDIGFAKDDPLFLFWSQKTTTSIMNVSGGEESLSRKNSYFARFNYDYQGKYFLQGSIRADAADSSVLPVTNRWGYFPAVSAGWTVSREDFMASTRSWLTHLKVRASWGQNGSTAGLGGYRYATVITSTGSIPTGNGSEYVYGYAPSATGNPQLGWEKSEQINVGLDARMLNDRLTITADWYNKTTKDLIVSGAKPSYVVGNTASPINSGHISNTGVELEVGWQDNIGDFRYSIRGNAATLKNEVTRIHETLDALDGTSFHTYGAITRFEVGRPAWYFYGYEFDKIDPATGTPLFKDLNGDGEINDSDKTMIGKGLPSLTYGLTLNLAYKGLDFVVFGTGSAGNDIYCCLNRSDYILNKLTYFTNDRWTPENVNGSMPKAGANDLDMYMISSASVFDGSYFKIKQIQVGYTLPARLTNVAKVSNLRLYCSLDDFFTFCTYPGFDPEVTGVGSGLGVDKGSYPTSKKVVFGVSLKF